MESIQYKSIEIDEVPGILGQIEDYIYDKLGEMYTPKTIYISKKGDSKKFICICETLIPVEIVNNRIEEQERILASATKTDIISFTPIFGVLSKSKIKKISPLLKRKKFSSGEIIFEDGEKADELYIIKTGKILVYKYIDREKSKFEVLATLCKGDILGEMAIIDDQPRSAYSKAVMEDCELYYMKKEDFLEILNKYPEISLNLNKIYCQRLRAASNKLIDYLSTTGPPKLSATHKEKKEPEKEIKEEKTQELLATRELSLTEMEAEMPKEKPPKAKTSTILSPEEIIQRRREMLTRSKVGDLSKGKGILFRRPRE